MYCILFLLVRELLAWAPHFYLLVFFLHLVMSLARGDGGPRLLLSLSLSGGFLEDAEGLRKARTQTSRQGCEKGESLEFFMLLLDLTKMAHVTGWQQPCKTEVYG
jgi:hypothetical protein